MRWTGCGKQLAHDQLVDLVAIDKRLAAINTEIRDAVRATGTTLTEIFGIGSVNAAMILGEVGQVARFATRHHFAAYNGTAPAQWGSGGDTHDRVNLGGNRRLNHAVHIAAVTQVRYPGPGRDYYQRKLADAKTVKEALRALKRRISDSIYRQLLADAKARDAEVTGPGGQVGAALSSSAANRSPMVSTSDKPQPGPVTTDPTPTNPSPGNRSSAASRRPSNTPTRRPRQAQSA